MSCLETGVLPHAQTPNPQVIQQDLTGSVGNELAVISGDSHPQVSLFTECLDLIGEKLLGVVII